MYKLCTYDVFDFKPNGNRRSEKEKNNLLNRLYQEKRMDLKEKKEQKEQAALEMLLLIFEEERNLKPNYPDDPRDKYLGRSSGAYSTKILNIRGKMRECCELTLKEKKLIEEARTAHLLRKEE